MEKQIKNGLICFKTIMNKTNINENDQFLSSDIHILGKYGEDIIISSFNEIKYKISCYELGIVEEYLTEKEEKKFYNKYVIEGVHNFDRTDIDKLKSRANNMGSRLSRFYNLYIQTPNDEQYETTKLLYAFELHKILEDSLVLKLTDNQYKDWLLFHKPGKNDEYVDLMFSLIKSIKRI